MTLHYHRLYQISSLKANFSSEHMKYLALWIDREEATFTGIHTPKLITKPHLFHQ